MNGHAPASKKGSPGLRLLGVTLAIAIACIAFFASVLLVESRLAKTSALQHARQPTYWALRDTHAPFSIKQEHPEYGFFLPQGAGKGVEASVHISPSGFRGPGPTDIGDRELAFLVGNSVVFGFVPDDSLTISGHLNRIQSRFFFVNAGVPSWVSGQMRRRLGRDLLKFNPRLIVFWAGHNDASVSFSRASRGQDYSYDTFEEPTTRPGYLERLASSIAPLTWARIQKTLSSTAPGVAVDVNHAASAAEILVENFRAAYVASIASGSSFLAVYQPILHHHSNRPGDIVTEASRQYFDRFYLETMALAADQGLPLLDLSSMFDTLYQVVPVFRAGQGPDLKDQVFVDPVHLYVEGNRLAASAIHNHLRSMFSEKMP